MNDPSRNELARNEFARSEFGRANARSIATPLTRAVDTLTHVELTFIEKKIEHWIRFGRRVGTKILDRRRRIVSFAPGSIFAYVRWASNDFGTVVSRIDIVRAVAPGEPYQTLPFVRPGGDILLRVDTWPKVERVLRAIDEIEGIGFDPVEIAPDHWRHLHNRLTAGQEPRAYTSERHDAWLKRRRIAP